MTRKLRLHWIPELQIWRLNWAASPKTRNPNANHPVDHSPTILGAGSHVLHGSVCPFTHPHRLPLAHGSIRDMGSQGETIHA